MRGALAACLFFALAIFGCQGPQIAAHDPQQVQGASSRQRYRAVMRGTAGANARHRSNRAAQWFLAADGPEPARNSEATGRPHSTARMFDEDPDLAIQDDPAVAARGPLPGLWDTIERDLRMAPRDLWEDTKSVYGKGPNLIILGLTYGGSLALQQTRVDDKFADAHSRPNSIFKQDIGEAFGALGNPATHFGVAGLWYLVGQQRQDEPTYEIGRTLFSALTINGVSTMLGKLAVSERSPNGEKYAFPSGHTSSTFTIASVMHQAYGPWVGAPLYALGAFVATERIDNGEHYFSDVVMGAVMGLVIGHAVAGEHELEIFGGRIVPYADPEAGATGIAWHVSF
jgi:membrane-associated phospholipid phosphatase